MAQITLTIPDAVAPRVLDAVAVSYGYVAGSGQTKAQFTKQYLLDLLKRTTRDYEANLAASQAAQAAAAATEAEIVLS